MITLYHGDCLVEMSKIADGSVDCCVTSPPYWGLRDYGVDGQLGMEKTPQEYVENMVKVFREVRRILKPDGTLWLNLGDSYAGSMKGLCADGTAAAGKKQATNRGSVGIQKEMPLKAEDIGLKPKDLVGIPWRVAFALQADGWYLRQDIIWHKPNPMPESVRDRCTKAHEYIFLLSKSDKYYFDYEAIKERAVGGASGNKVRTDATVRSPHFREGTVASGVPWSGGELRQKRSVWSVTTKPFKGAHFATFPPDLIEPCILAGCPKGGTVLDPFFGAGTTGLVASKHDRNCVGVELNEGYLKIAQERIEKAKETLF